MPPTAMLGTISFEPDRLRDATVKVLRATEIADAYELLLLEAMEGDHSLFIRQDGVERAWEILQPILGSPTPIRPYAKGSWGPAAADDLIRPRKWHVTGAHQSHDYRGRAFPIVASD